MSILIANDDGIDAPGLHALEAALVDLTSCTTIAPEKERSAQSHALTLHKPLRAHPRGERRWAASGTPADCVYLGLHHFLRDDPPAVVVSGINNGSNIGDDVFYSGTVAAAREGCLHGYAAVAVSLDRNADPVRHWDTAAQVARRVVQRVLKQGLPKGIYLNVNVPNVEPDALRGLKACVLGRREYASAVEPRTDPRGRTYFWLGGDHLRFTDIDGADGPALETGWATVTPFAPDLTCHDWMEELRGWTDA